MAKRSTRKTQATDKPSASNAELEDMRDLLNAGRAALHKTKDLLTEHVDICQSTRTGEDGPAYVPTETPATAIELARVLRQSSPAVLKEALGYLSPGQRRTIVECSEELDREAYERLLFGDGPKTIHRLNKFLEAARARDIPIEEKPIYAQAISWAVREKFTKAALYFVPEKGAPVPCTITTETFSGGTGRSFQIRKKGGDRTPLSRRATLPHLRIE